MLFLLTYSIRMVFDEFVDCGDAVGGFPDGEGERDHLSDTRPGYDGGFQFRDGWHVGERGILLESVFGEHGVAADPLPVEPPTIGKTHRSGYRRDVGWSRKISEVSLSVNRHRHLVGIVAAHAECGSFWNHAYRSVASLYVAGLRVVER